MKSIPTGSIARQPGGLNKQTSLARPFRSVMTHHNRTLINVRLQRCRIGTFGPQVPLFPVRNTSDIPQKIIHINRHLSSKQNDRYTNSLSARPQFLKYLPMHIKPIGQHDRSTKYLPNGTTYPASDPNLKHRPLVLCVRCAIFEDHSHAEHLNRHQ
jgi:hypothetical protein